MVPRVVGVHPKSVSDRDENGRPAPPSEDGPRRCAGAGGAREGARYARSVRQAGRCSHGVTEPPLPRTGRLTSLPRIPCACSARAPRGRPESFTTSASRPAAPTALLGARVRGLAAVRPGPGRAGPSGRSAGDPESRRVVPTLAEGASKPGRRECQRRECCTSVLNSGAGRTRQELIGLSVEPIPIQVLTHAEDTAVRKLEDADRLQAERRA